MKTMPNTSRKKSKTSLILRPELWLLALALAAAWLASDAPTLYLKSALFYLNPRYAPEWTRYLLALLLVWTIVDYSARLLYARIVRRRAAEAPSSADVSSRATSAWRVSEKWNAASAVLLLATSLALNAACDCGYRSVTRSALIEDPSAIPTLSDFSSRGSSAAVGGSATRGFMALGCVSFACLAFLTLVYVLRLSLLQRRLRALSERAIHAALSSSYVSYAIALTLWDVGVYLTAFVVWSVYRYYYLPVATYMYTYKIGRAQLFSVALIIMAFLSLLSLAAILRSDKT